MFEFLNGGSEEIEVFAYSEEGGLIWGVGLGLLSYFLLCDLSCGLIIAV